MKKGGKKVMEKKRLSLTIVLWVLVVFFIYFKGTADASAASENARDKS
jgi:hypothetical protein